MKQQKVISGPNTRKLFIQFLARESVPDGGGIDDGFRFFTDTEHRNRCVAGAEAKMRYALAAAKAAPDNPYGDDDEKIAEVILERLEKVMGERGIKR